MHTDLGIGDPVTVQAPENSFPLVEAPEYLFIGGGIGITPLVGMAYFCDANDKPFRLIYCARSEEHAAYCEQLKSTFGDRVVVHFDGGDPEKAYDFWEEFMTPNANHTYCCGPKPLMEEIQLLVGTGQRSRFILRISIHRAAGSINLPLSYQLNRPVRAFGLTRRARYWKHCGRMV